MCVCCRQSSSTCFTYQVKIRLQTRSKTFECKPRRGEEGLWCRGFHRGIQHYVQQATAKTCKRLLQSFDQLGTLPAAEWEVWFYRIPSVIHKELYKRTSAPHHLLKAEQVPKKTWLILLYVLKTQDMLAFFWPVPEMGCYIPLQGRCSAGQIHNHPPKHSIAPGSVPWASPSFPSQLLTGYSKQEMNFSWNSQSEVRNIQAKQPEEEDDALGLLAQYDSQLLQSH